MLASINLSVFSDTTAGKPFINETMPVLSDVPLADFIRKQVVRKRPNIVYADNEIKEAKSGSGRNHIHILSFPISNFIKTLNNEEEPIELMVVISLRPFLTVKPPPPPVISVAKKTTSPVLLSYPPPSPPKHIPSTKAKRASHYLSASEFLQSRRMPNAIVLLQQEDKSTSHAHVDVVSIASCYSSKRPIENAVRVALSLTQSFVDFFSKRGNSSSIPSLVLGDFFINYEQECTSKVPTQLPPLQVPARGADSIITLHGVDLILPEITEDPQCQQEQYTKQGQLQNLGKILYSIFCHGESPLSEMIASSSSQTNGEDADDNKLSTEDLTVTVKTLFERLIEGEDEDGTNRSTKASRVTKKTLFTRLVENAILPKSICRFLSDMIDIGPNGKSASPFTSFEDIIQDLEQMISQPETFLHDSQYIPVESRAPVFGQKCHGREKEVVALMALASFNAHLLANGVMEQSSHRKGVQATFVSGIAGSGKSYLVQTVGEKLSSLGWLVVKAKFKRSTEHASRGILSSMFDEIITYLLKLKESEIPADVAYSQRASKSILDSIGHDDLPGLVDFLPSLSLLFDGIGKVQGSNHSVQAKQGEWQLSHLLTTVLEAVLESGRFIMICYDDLQWADKSTLSLISHILMHVGSNIHTRCRCLFVGLYRLNEIDVEHPLSIQYSSLQLSSSVNLTEINLSSFSKEDVIDMMMVEFQLPGRLVMGLADVVYKKTAGHCLFLVELLNSLLRDSIVAYSSEKGQYTWDDDRISIIQTGDSVAELIASNLKSLTQELQQILQILSCFGIQTDDSLLLILERFQEGINGSVDSFIEQGVLDRAGPIVIFTHDLIQQAVYESMSLDERKSLHLRVGQYLGTLASVNATQANEPVTEEFGQLHLKDQVFYSGRNLASTLLSIACDQVNAAGSDYIHDERVKAEFAGWNLSAGQSFAFQSNFSASLYYYSNGISFLGTECWCEDTSLSLELHYSAVMSSFALGEADKVDQYAQQVIENAPFEDTIGVQRIVLKSLTLSDRHQECISRGIGILRQLNFHIPLAPCNENILNAMSSTTSMAAQYSMDSIISLCHGNTDGAKYAAVRIMLAFYVSAFITASSFVPLIACEIVKFSLQNSVCPESAVSFATFALLKIRFDADYSGGKYWADIARNIIKNCPKKNKESEISVELILHFAVDIYFMSPRNISSKLISLHHDAMKIGQVDSAMMSLAHAWRFRLLGGHNLSLIFQSFEDQRKLIARHSKFCSKFLTLDSMLLITLTGQSIDCFSAFGDSICSLDDLRSEAESSHDNRWLYNFHVIGMLTAYWKGYYTTAEEHSLAALAYPTAKMRNLLSIYHIFFGCLIALQLHRQVGDNDDQRLNQGREMIEKLENWAQNSLAVYENKWLLMKAEYVASIGEHDKAVLLYKASIKSAEDHGNIHELALAFELLGNYYCSTNGYDAHSNECFRKAHLYYKQWGATAMAEKLMHRHDLSIEPVACTEPRVGKSKNPRE